MEAPAWTFKPLEPLLCARPLAGHEFQRMNQMDKELWITVCLDGEGPRSYGNPEGTDHKGGADQP